MTANTADIIAQLKKDILPLQGIHAAAKSKEVDVLLGPIKLAFPNNSFPVGVIHEFISHAFEEEAATNGFVSGIIASLARSNGAIIWVSASRSIFPPALQTFGIAPDRIIFIDLKKEKEILWVMEEALKSKGLAAVVGEMQDLNFTASRRLQLAVEQSRVTGFVLRRRPRQLNITACVTRWKIVSLESRSPGGMPGVGFPRWSVELLKVRNGTPGKWEIEFSAGRFKFLPKIATIPYITKQKTG